MSYYINKDTILIQNKSGTNTNYKIEQFVPSDKIKKIDSIDYIDIKDLVSLNKVKDSAINNNVFLVKSSYKLNGEDFLHTVKISDTNDIYPLKLYTNSLIDEGSSLINDWIVPGSYPHLKSIYAFTCNQEEFATSSGNSYYTKIERSSESLKIYSKYGNNDWTLKKDFNKETNRDSFLSKDDTIPSFLYILLESGGGGGSASTNTILAIGSHSGSGGAGGGYIFGRLNLLESTSYIIEQKYGGAGGGTSNYGNKKVYNCESGVKGSDGQDIILYAGDQLVAKVLGGKGGELDKSVSNDGNQVQISSSNSKPYLIVIKSGIGGAGGARNTSGTGCSGFNYKIASNEKNETNIELTFNDKDGGSPNGAGGGGASLSYDGQNGVEMQGWSSNSWHVGAGASGAHWDVEADSGSTGGPSRLTLYY